MLTIHRLVYIKHWPSLKNSVYFSACTIKQWSSLKKGSHYRLVRIHSRLQPVPRMSAMTLVAPKYTLFSLLVLRTYCLLRTMALYFVPPSGGWGETAED